MAFFLGGSNETHSSCTSYISIPVETDRSFWKYGNNKLNISNGKNLAEKESSPISVFFFTYVTHI